MNAQEVAAFSSAAPVSFSAAAVSTCPPNLQRTSSNFLAKLGLTPAKATDSNAR